jgi:hypothetical protein
MTNIFIDILILLEHQSQVAKDIFLVYHLTIESNISLLLCGSTEITLYVLRFRPTRAKTFCLQGLSSQLHFFGQHSVILSSTKTTSSIKSIHQRIPPYMSLVTLSITNITKANRQGLRADHWCSHILIGTSAYKSRTIIRPTGTECSNA